MPTSPRHAEAVAVEDVELDKLPDGWVMTTLGEVRLDKSKSIDPSKLPGQMFELYSVPSFPDRRPEIVANDAIGSSKRTVETNAVMLCKINPRINRVWIVGDYSPHQKIASTEWLSFFQISGLDPWYLGYSLQQHGFRDYLAANASGVGGSLMRIRGTTFTDYSFPLAPLSEQHRIVAEIEKQFTRLDASVAALRRTRANLKRYRASVLKAACEGRLVPTEAKLARSEGRDYEPAAQLLERILAERRARREAQEKPRGRYKEPDAPDHSDLPGLPNGWVWTTLPQLGELNRGKSKHRPRNDPRLLGGSYPFVQTGDIRHSQGLVTRHSQTYTEFGLAQSRLWPSGTLCITIAANIAETGILSYPACFPDSVVGFVCYDDPVISKFLEFFVRTEREGLERFAPATAQKNLNLKVLSDLAVPLPPLAEQHRLVAEVERLLSVINQTETTVEANLTRAERLRQSILKEAFSGKLVPPDPNDEPASVLLQRIRAEREAAQAAAKPKSGAKRRRARSSSERQLVLGVQEKTS